MSLDLTARKVVMSSLLYYGWNSPILSDGEYDQMCIDLANDWDQLSAFRQWQLGDDPLDILASGMFVKVTLQAAYGAREWYRSVNKTQPRLCVIPDKLQYSEEHKVRWFPPSL